MRQKGKRTKNGAKMGQNAKTTIAARRRVKREWLRTKPPKVKLPGLLPPLPALWATVRVGVWASQAAWNLAAVSQSSKVEQHRRQCCACVQPLRSLPQPSVISREPGKWGPPHAAVLLWASARLSWFAVQAAGHEHKPI